jgi:hypothetical protein
LGELAASEKMNFILGGGWGNTRKVILKECAMKSSESARILGKTNTTNPAKTVRKVMGEVLLLVGEKIRD